MKLKRCDVCLGDIEIQEATGWTDGHNADPITKGRACERCNEELVIPVRIAFATGDPEEVADLKAVLKQSEKLRQVRKKNEQIIGIRTPP